MVRTVKSLTKIQATRIAALLVLAALLGAGVQTAMAAENTMTIAIGDSAGIGTDPTLFPFTFPNIGGLQYYHQYTHYEPLITFDVNGNLIPWLAESYEVSNDLKTITFHLRKGITFADGKPLNASVLKFYYDRVFTYGYENAYGKNGAKIPLFIYYDNSEALDEYSLKIHFTKGWLDMAPELSLYGWYIHPEDVDPAWDIKGTLKPEKRFNGLGPYCVDENESISNQMVVLKRRPSWRDDYDFHKPILDQIVLKLITDPQIAVMALEKGEIDYIGRYWNVPLDSLPALEKNSKISIITAPESLMYYLKTAYWKEPFSGEDGILLRKAICYALNRTEMVEGAFNGYALPATDAMLLSPIKPDSPECCHKGYDYDLDKAKMLLAEAGWDDMDGDGILDKNGKSLKDLDLLISSDSRVAWQRDLALVVKSQLKEIGIDVQIHTVEWLDFVQNNDFDLKMYFSYGGTRSSVQEFGTFHLKGSSGGTSATAMNDYSNQDQTLPTIVDMAEMADSSEEREEFLCQACDILYDEAGIIPLVYPMQYAVMNSKVKGFQLGLSKYAKSQYHEEECWIE